MSTIQVDAIQNTSGQSEVSVTTLKADTIQNTSGASIIKVDTLQKTSGQSVGYCLAWGNFENVSGPTLRRGLNVSSLTDVTTNTTDVNFSTAFPDTTYNITAAEQNASSTTHSNFYSCHWRVVSSSQIRQQWYSTDSNFLGFACFS